MAEGPTRAELALQLTDARSERDAWREIRQADREAEAISSCVVALKKISTASNPGYGHTENREVRRVLNYLAERFGVQWRGTDG